MIGAAPFMRGSSRPSRLFDSDRLVEETERLARHAFRGELWDKAVEYLLRAGRRALFASATGEAVECFEQALLALRRLPQTPETLHKALGLRLNLRDALWSLGQITKIREQLVEAEAIADQLGDQRGLGMVACFRCHYFWSVGELDAALEASERALEIANTLGDPLLLAETELYRCIIFLAQGENERATEILQRTLQDLDRLVTGKPATANRAIAIWLLVRSFLTRSLAELGRFEEGIACGEEGLRIVEPDQHPFWAGNRSGRAGFAVLAQGRAAGRDPTSRARPRGMPHLQRQQLDSDDRGLAGGRLRGHRAC